MWKNQLTRRAAQNKTTKRRKRGHPPFVPTPTERRFVQAMAGARMSYDEICKVIGSSRGRQESDDGTGDGKPIAKTTLMKHFSNELRSGRAMLKARIVGAFYAALDDDAPWAIQLGLRMVLGWRDNANVRFSVGDDAAGEQPRKMVLEFVVPGQKLDNHAAPSALPPPRQLLGDVLDLRANPPSSGVPVVPKKRNSGTGWMA